MAYKIKRSDPDLGVALRRIAQSQLRAAIRATRDEKTAEAGIHEVRQRCKKLRGLLRLVRPGFKDYDRESAAIRDAARLTTDLRDTSALLATHDALMQATDTARIDFASLRGALTRARDEVYGDGTLHDTLDAQRDALTKILNRSADWEVRGKPADVIGAGVRKTWKRAAAGMPKRPEGSSPGQMHDWRKRAKDHWCQTRLLRKIWPGPMKAHAQQCGGFAEMLGDHHDLAVYEVFLASDRAPRIDPDRASALHALLSARKERLEREAWLIGARLFAPPVEALPKQWDRHWALWRKGA